MHERVQRAQAEMQSIQNKHGITLESAHKNIAAYKRVHVESSAQLRRRMQETKREIEEIQSKITYPVIDGVYGKMCELVSVSNAANVVAVGVVLGSRKEYVVVENEAVVKRVIELVAAQGRRIDVIPLSKITARVLTTQKEDAAKRAGAKLLLDAVEYDARVKKAVEYVFGGYILAPDRAVAVQLRDKEEMTSVTVDGELFDRRGTVTGGSIDRSKFVFSKPQTERLRVLEQELHSMKEVLRMCTLDKLEQSQKIVQLDTERAEAETKMQSAAQTIADSAQEEDGTEEDVEKAAKMCSKLKKLHRRAVEQREKEEQCASECARTKASLDAKKAEAEKLEHEIDVLESKKAEGINKNEMNRARRSIQAREEKRVAEEVLALRKEISRNESRIAKLADANTEDERSTKYMTECKHTRSKAENEDKSVLTQSLRELETEHARIAKATKKDINTKHIEMLEKNEELERMLKEKIAKLQKNKETIQKSIQKLNVLEKETIETIFESVNKRVGRYVSYFIPHADARLEAINGSPMNGVEFLVKIGTWKKGLTELSGGQKSICALSLIFSLLKSRPSPLYILDEIDAALDASHTEAMGRMIQKEFAGSQFLVVSLKDGMYHNASALFQTYIREGTSGVQKI